MPEYKDYELVGGRPVKISPLTVSEAGTTFAEEGCAFNPVICNASGVTEADNGKVVVDGELVSQTAMPYMIVENGVYDTTQYNSVDVSVSAGDYNLITEVNNAPTLADAEIGNPGLSGNHYGSISFNINLGGNIVPVSFAITLYTPSSGYIITGGAFDESNSQAAVMQFTYDPTVPENGMTCTYLVMVVGSTLTDLTSSAASIISDITIQLYEHVS